MGPMLDKFEYPIKLGTTVYGRGGRNSFHIPVMARIDGQADSGDHMARRSDFDDLLLKTALERGVDMFPGQAVFPLKEGDTLVGVRCRSTDGIQEDIRGEVVVDCSGQGTFLANRGV